MKRTRFPGLGRTSAASTLTAVALCCSASAATIVVDTLSDVDAADAAISLREAIIAANTNAAHNDAPAGEAGVQDEISFDSALAGTIVLGSEIAITDALLIMGTSPATLSVSGNDACRVFNVSAATTFAGLHITHGNAGTGNGGAILSTVDIMLNGSEISHSSGGRGGAVYVDNAILSMYGTYVHHNTGVTDSCTGGGIYVTMDAGSGVGIQATACTISDNTAAGDGGGIALYYAGSTLQRCTISGNSATGGRGGAIYMQSDWNYDHLITNSTISGNSATADAGGMTFGDNSTTTIRNSTITLNTCDSDNTGDGDGGALWYADAVILESTIVAGNIDASTAAEAHDLCQVGSGSVTASCCLVGDANGGHGVVDGASGNLVGDDPLLGALADNGGITQTHLPDAGSPVLDAGSNSASLTTDQRDLDRTSGTATDIGAVEVQVAPPANDDDDDDDCGAGTGSASCVMLMWGAIIGLRRRTR